MPHTDHDPAVPATPAAPRSGTRLRDRIGTVVAALVVALVVWLVATALAGVDLQVAQNGLQTVGVGAVVLVVVVAVLLGWALLALLERFTGRAKTVWSVVAIVVTVLSLAGPITSALSTSALVTLAVMHLAVGAVTITGFRRTVH